MFFHQLKHSLKTLFKNKVLLFWTFAFPLVLATLFHLAFSNIENSETLKIIDIAIVQNETFEQNPVLKQAFATIGKDGPQQIFDIQYTNEEEAKQLLEQEKITGYLSFTDKANIVITKNGINETVFTSVTEEVLQTATLVNTMAKEEIEKQLQNGTLISYEQIYAHVLSQIQEINPNIKDTSSSHLSYTMIEFYTLIAMTCLYGGILGMTSIHQNLANMSNKGKRVAISPTPKGILILGSVIASYIAQLIGIAILFLFTIFVLKVDYGSHLLEIIVLTLTGCLAGLSLGIAIGSLVKTNDNTKTGIIISITMLGCFLSGMMGITMKYIIDKNIPILNQINPANMITDGLYSLYYYDTFTRYWFNVISLLIFAGVLIFLSCLGLRRQQYDNI